jgi:hypothetical protein
VHDVTWREELPGLLAGRFRKLAQKVLVRRAEHVTADAVRVQPEPVEGVKQSHQGSFGQPVLIAQLTSPNTPASVVGLACWMRCKVVASFAPTFTETESTSFQ